MIAQRGDIELKSLMAQPATIAIRQADGRYRSLSGLVETAALLGEDGGVFYYQLTPGALACDAEPGTRQPHLSGQERP